MMELRSIIVLCFASTVIATPYGYGVKGGASAKAEANAAAGAFAGLPAIPLSIPSGPGISGSFSKSSSSSFASSSASSSSSSSSYSFSGAGANDLRVNGGCSGGCQNKGGNDETSLSNGAFDSNYKSDGSNAGNSAVAGQGSSSIPSYSQNNYQPCAGANCNEYGKNQKCSSGQCLPGPSSENEDDNDDERDSQDGSCISANCKQGLTEQTNSENDSNDIKVNVAGNSNNYGAKASNFGGSSQDGKSTSGCYNGNCYPAVSQTLQPPNPYGNNNVRPTPSSGVSVSPKCLTPNCDPNNPTFETQGTTAPGYNQPSQHLSTPNYGPGCTTYPCYSQPSGSVPHLNNGQLPTSYNAPISTVQGSSPIPQNKNTPCLSGPCLNNNLPSVAPAYGTPSDSSSHSSINTGRVTNPSYGTSSYSSGIGHNNAGQYQTQPSGPSLCQGSSCDKPNFGINANLPSPNIPSNCGIGSTPGCGYNPDATSGPGGQPGLHTDLPRLDHNLTPNTEPIHSGHRTPPQSINTQPGFPGLIKGSGIHNADENMKNYAFNPSLPSIPTPNNGLVPPTLNPANSGSYGNTNLPSTYRRPGIYSAPFESPKPNTGLPTNNYNNIPTYTGTSGAPSSSYGSLSKPINENSERYPNSPGSYSPYSGAPNFGSHSPSGAVEFSKPSSFGPSSQYHPTHTSVSPGGASAFLPVSTKPGVTNVPKPFVEKEKIPYSGGFGGPSGLLKPNEYDLPEKIPTSPDVQKSGSCSSGGDCGPKSYKTPEGPSAFANGATSSASATAQAKATAYTGGFGGPSGLLVPNDDKKPLKFVPLHGKGAQDFGGASQYGHSAGVTGNGNEHSSNEENGNGAHNNGNAVAQASAVASAQAGALSNGNQASNNGCSLCSAPNAVNGANGNYASSSGLSNAGIGGDYSNLNAGAVAAAKSVANAGAGSYRHGGSFASSSASAHASAGAPTKGGYGRR